MKSEYNPKLVESYSQFYWEKSSIDLAHEKEDSHIINGKFYACSMLPYPSGKLHMGHVRNYTINDVMARYMRMNGYNVLMPMGWDSFGMPAENAAIQSGISPAIWTETNISQMKSQLKQLGLSIDWTREISTCDPKYYKWNQWMFLKFLEHGLVYRTIQTVNWDPIDKTVLANEQVHNGRGWRSGAIVEKREIPGYYLRITHYAEELLSALEEELAAWPSSVKTMQSHWIGKSTGSSILFPHCITNERGQLISDGYLKVFTTKLETLMGVTFCAISPTHQIANYLASKDKRIAKFLESHKKGGTSEIEHIKNNLNGVNTNICVFHPLNHTKIPLWIADYVRGDYAYGAIMGVPAHNEQDFLFAKKYNICIKQVIDSSLFKFDENKWNNAYNTVESGRMINSHPYDSLSCTETRKILQKTLYIQNKSKIETIWRLKDWSISRQRYWGTPIPIVHCKNCGLVPVSEKDLPILLPTSLIPDGSGNPLDNSEFTLCKCPKCNNQTRRETDTMDTFVDSAWYFMRYTSYDNHDVIVDHRNNYWMPVDYYIGGIEHAILHLLYARFWVRAMRDIGIIQLNEPFKKLLCQGMVLNHLFARTNKDGSLIYFSPDDVKKEFDGKGKIIKAFSKLDGEEVQYLGVGTMSKSKKNGVDPAQLINRWGADAIRLFTIFSSPPEKNLEWSEFGINGAYKFLERLWKLAFLLKNTAHARRNKIHNDFPKKIIKFKQKVQLILKQITRDYKKLQYNTIVSGGMKMLNLISELFETNHDDNHSTILEAFGILLRVLYPVVPHITWFIWNELEFNKEVGDLPFATWPKYEEQSVSNKIEIAFQINGKFKERISVNYDASFDEVKAAAMNSNSMKKIITIPFEPENIIFIPNKVINIIIKS